MYTWCWSGMCLGTVPVRGATVHDPVCVFCCPVMPSLPALSIPTVDSSLNAASLKHSEFPYRLQSAKGTLLKILDEPGDTGGPPRCGCDCGQVTLPADWNRWMWDIPSLPLQGNNLHSRWCCWSWMIWGKTTEVRMGLELIAVMVWGTSKGWFYQKPH